MGKYRIEIEGTGSHHNCTNGMTSMRAQDADQLAVDFVAWLRSQGHQVNTARFIVEGASVDDLLAYPQADSVPPKEFAAVPPKVTGGDGANASASPENLDPQDAG